MEVLDWLYQNSGPIIRWRLVSDFDYRIPAPDKKHLFNLLIEFGEVKRWMNNFEKGGVHGSKDTNAENVMAKLYEYGIRKGYSPFDDIMIRYADAITDFNPNFIQSEVPFLIATGFQEHPNVMKVFRNRLTRLYKTAKAGNYNFYLKPDEKRNVPKAWKDKQIYRAEYCSPGVEYPLPSIYDLIALSKWQTNDRQEIKMIEAIIAFISNNEFQKTPGGYLWNRESNACHAAGRVYLACCNPERLVMFLEYTAKYEAARKQGWFNDAVDKLKACKTTDDRYVYPADMLKEKESYYTYQGSHMGLGENRADRKWREIESTFRMHNLIRLMHNAKS